jgi:predicted ATP-dependent endonuclease of OLD family
MKRVHINSIEIEEFQGFYEKQKIEFAIPNGKPGSGLTIIVGPNNTGKTSVIEALQFSLRKRLSEHDRHIGKKATISIETNDGTASVSNKENSGHVDVTNSQLLNTMQLEIIASRRYWDYIIENGRYFSDFQDETARTEVRGVEKNYISKIFSDIYDDKVKYKAFNKIVKDILPHTTGWSIDYDTKDYIKYIGGNAEHRASNLGDGVISVFRVAAHLALNEDGRILIIDEPELSLHPSAQKVLNKYLSRYSATKQIIVCTHSPYFIDWQDYINGGVFIRLNKHNDTSCSVSKLKDSGQYFNFITKNLYNYQKPQLLDIVAKELLFSTKVLFVEGQEDVGLIRKYLTENGIDYDFDIFGYGVGGYSNIKPFIELAEDLGILKIGVLFDSGGEGQKIYNELKTLNKHCMEKLETEDIRDKESSCKKCTQETIKRGYFNSRGELKQEYSDSFKSIIESFTNYFKD